MLLFALLLLQVIELVVLLVVAQEILTDRRLRVLNRVRDVVLRFHALLNVWSPPRLPRNAVPVMEYIRRKRR